MKYGLRSHRKVYRIRTFSKCRRNCCNATLALYILKPVSPVPFAATEPDVKWVVSRRTVKRRLRDRRIARFPTGLFCLYSVASRRGRTGERQQTWKKDEDTFIIAFLLKARSAVRVVVSIRGPCDSFLSSIDHRICDFMSE